MFSKLSTVKPLRHSTHIATYLVLRKGNQVLMGVRQNTGHMDGYWGLPAGHLEEGESLAASLVREAFEEVGIEVAPSDLHLAHALHSSSDAEYLSLYFECTNWCGEISNPEPHKCLGWEFVSIDTLPENTVPYIRDTVSAIEQKIPYREVGWI